MGSRRAQREADLVSYYDNEIHDRAGRKLPSKRVDLRTSFIGLLNHESRRSLLEVGSGPGRDGTAFAAAGLRYTGVDLAPRSVEVCRGQGLNVELGSVLSLPFADHSFDAAWTMSTLVHVADADLDAGLLEISRVVRPGAPVALGLWGDDVSREETWSDDKFGPPRFFSIHTDEHLQEALERHGDVEEWVTWPGDGALHYQWAILRLPAAAPPIRAPRFEAVESGTRHATRRGGDRDGH